MSLFGGIYNFGLAARSAQGADISTSDPKYAQKTFAQLTRDQWADYLNRFVPVEDAMIGTYQSPEKLASTLNTARDVSNNAFASASGTEQRQGARYGIDINSDQTYRRRMNLGQAASSVDATNAARMYINDLDKQLLGSGVSTTAQGV